jgi:hypothetical protein
MTPTGKPNDTTLTPLSLIAKLGEFDLDPCAYREHRTAKRLVVWPEDGLAAEWSGRVWLNPPYSSPEPWMRKLRSHGNGIALVLASVDTAWFHNEASGADGICFIRGRPNFLRTDGSAVQLMRATILIAFGHLNALSLAQSGLGPVFCPSMQVAA